MMAKNVNDGHLCRELSKSVFLPGMQTQLQPALDCAGNILWSYVYIRQTGFTAAGAVPILHLFSLAIRPRVVFRASPPGVLALSQRTTERNPEMEVATKSLATKSQELRAFLVISVFLAPVLAFALVTGYGFLVWMYQIVAGPPGTTL